MLTTEQEEQKEILDEPTLYPESKNQTLALIGEMGSGKSSTGNSLTNQQLFITSSGTASCTQACKMVTTNWFNDPKLEQINIIDTPGLGGKKDDAVIVDMVTELQKVGKIDVFALVFNADNPRFGRSAKEMVTLYEKVCDGRLFDNCMIIITHWSNEPRAKVKRTQERMTEERKSKEMNEAVQRELQLSHNPNLPCFFIDNTLTNPEVAILAGVDELESVRGSLEKIRAFTRSKKGSGIKVINLRSILSENNRLNLLIDKVIEDHGLTRQDLADAFIQVVPFIGPVHQMYRGCQAWQEKKFGKAAWNIFAGFAFGAVDILCAVTGLGLVVKELATFGRAAKPVAIVLELLKLVGVQALAIYFGKTIERDDLPRVRA